MKNLTIVILICLTASFLSVRADTPARLSVEERLLELERKIDSLTQENGDLRDRLGVRPEAAPVIVQPAGQEKKLVVGGFLQGQGEFGHASDSRWAGVKDRFFFRRARIHVAGSFSENFEFKAELDLQGNTLGAGTGQLARANEIFVNWNKYPFANLRFGQLKPAFGAEQLMSDTKMLTIERSLASDRLADGRQLAVGVAGDILDKKISYLGIFANGNGSNVSGNDNSRFAKSARVAFTPIASETQKVVVGINGLWTQDSGVAKSDLGLVGNRFTGSRRMQGVDAQWTRGRLDFSAEWLHGTFRPADVTPSGKFSAEGWHGTVGYFIVPKTLQFVFRRESFDGNKAIGGNSSITNTYGLSFYIKGDDLKLSVNYLDGQMPGSINEGGRLLTRVQIIF